MEMKEFTKPEFEHLYYIEVEVEKAIKCGRLPEGKYNVIPIKGGSFKGDKLKGKVLHVGADWNTQRPPNFHISTRYLLNTDDGALISQFTDGNAKITFRGGLSMALGKPDP